MDTSDTIVDDYNRTLDLLFAVGASLCMEQQKIPDESFNKILCLARVQTFSEWLAAQYAELCMHTEDATEISLWTFILAEIFHSELKSNHRNNYIYLGREFRRTCISLAEFCFARHSSRIKLDERIKSILKIGVPKILHEFYRVICHYLFYIKAREYAENINNSPGNKYGLQILKGNKLNQKYNVNRTLGGDYLYQSRGDADSTRRMLLEVLQRRLVTFQQLNIQEHRSVCYFCVMTS